MSALTTTSELEFRTRAIRELVGCVNDTLHSFYDPPFDEDYKVQRHPELTSEAFDLLHEIAKELSELACKLASGEAIEVWDSSFFARANRAFDAEVAKDPDGLYTAFTGQAPPRMLDPMVQQYLDLRRNALVKRRELGELPQALEEWYSVAMHDLRGLLTPEQSTQLDAQLRETKRA